MSQHNGTVFEALEASIVAIDDWLHTYAADMCNENDVRESRERIFTNGGTLGYIAAVQKLNREALALAARD